MQISAWREWLLQTSGASGGHIDLSWTVRNFGAGLTDVDAWYDRIVLPAKDKCGDADDILLDAVPHTGALDPNAQYTVNNTLQLPLGIAGAYLVFVATDASHDVFEYPFEDNNVGGAVAPIQISPSPNIDLEAANLAAPSIGAAGEPTTINWSITIEAAARAAMGPRTAPSPRGPIGSSFRKIASTATAMIV